MAPVINTALELKAYSVHHVTLVYFRRNNKNVFAFIAAHLFVGHFFSPFLTHKIYVYVLEFLGEKTSQSVILEILPSFIIVVTKSRWRRYLL